MAFDLPLFAFLFYFMISAVIENLKGKIYDGKDVVFPFTAMYSKGTLYDFYYKARGKVVGVPEDAGETWIKAI
jgi:hypothetical protein